MFYPCTECYRKFGKEYTSDCDAKCDYARARRDLKLFQEELRRQDGYWIDHGYEIECSVCGFTCNDEWYLGEAVACPNCGVQMNGREDVTNIQYDL